MRQSGTTPIDWEARAKEAGAIGYVPATKTASKGKIDWAAAAKEAGAIGSTPAGTPVSGGQTTGHNLSPASDLTNEGFWHSLGSQVKAIFNPDVMFSASPVPNPQAAVEMAGNFTTALQQAKAPINPKTGLPFPDPTGALRAGHITAALLTPVGGETIEKGLEQLESGNVKGAAGTAVGAALPFAVGRLMRPRAPLPAAEVLPKHVEALTGLIEDRAGTVDPHATATEALPHLRETAVRMKIDPTAMGGREAGQATLKIAEQAVQDTQNEFNTIRKPYNAVLADRTPIAQSYLDGVTQELLENDPKTAQTLMREADKFAQLARNPDGTLQPTIVGPRPGAIEQINQFRTRMNRKMDALEGAGTTAQIMSNEEARANLAAARAARDIEYSTVGRLSGLDPEYIRALKQREGALIEAKTSLTKEYNRASGQQGEAVSKTLREKATSTFPSKHGAEKSVIKNILGPKPIDVLNSRINRMFEGMGEARALPEYQQIQPPEAPQVSGPSGPVPAGSVEDLAEEARRGGPGSFPPTAPSTAETFIRSSRMGTQQGIADQLSAAKSGKTAETTARVEQHKVAKKEIGEQVQAPLPPASVAGGQITPEHVAAENAFYTQARAELGADASPSDVLRRAQSLKVEHAAKSAPLPVTPANPELTAEVKAHVERIAEAGGRRPGESLQAWAKRYTEHPEDRFTQGDEATAHGMGITIRQTAEDILHNRFANLKRMARSELRTPVQPHAAEPPAAPQTLTQKMASRPLPKLRRVEAPRTGSAAAYQPSPAVQASLIMLQAKQGLISPAEADSRIQRLVGSGGRRTIRRPVGPE